MVVGSALVDVVVDVAHLPEPGGDVVATLVGHEPGGAFNVASAAARLGLPTVYTGPHGTGPNGDLLRAALAAEDIEVVGAADDDDTGFCLAMVEPSGERTFVTIGGADTRMSQDVLGSLALRDDDAVYVTGYDLAYPASGPVLARAVVEWPAAPLLVLDPGPLIADIPARHWDTVAPRIDVLTWSEREAQLLPELRDRLRDDAVVVRRTGSRGAVLELPGERAHLIAGAAVRPVDTNGAGDVHVGALLAARHDGLPWVPAVERANAAAALSTQRRGGATGPTREQLLTFLGRT